MNRRALGALIIAIWLSVIGWHVKREYFRTASQRMALGATTLAPGAHWFVIRMDGVAIGYAQSRLDTLEAGKSGYRFNDQIIIDIPAMDTVHRSIASTRIDLGPALELRAFKFSLGSDIGSFTVTGEVGADSAVTVVMDAGGGPQTTRLEAGSAMLLDAALTLRMAASGELRLGNEFTTRIFDPSSLSERDVTVKVTEKSTIIVPDSVRAVGDDFEVTVMDTVPVWRVEQKFGGVTIVNWVDEDGQVVRAESALGFVIERTAFELARKEWREAGASQRIASGYGSLIEGTAIASNVDVSRVDAQPRLSVRLRGVDLTGFDLAGGRQALHGDTLVITRESADVRANYSLPYAGGGPVAVELESTALIQANDPRIRAVAQQIAAGSKDPAEVARRLNIWVFTQLKKDITLSVPSALQVLEAKSGDCNEHTVLYVALARSLGLPTRTAVGLVHLRGNFYYHAWPEVWLGEWVAVDPTLGQYTADASHLRFLVGGLARQVELIRIIGKLRLEVI